MRRLSILSLAMALFSCGSGVPDNSDVPNVAVQRSALRSTHCQTNDACAPTDYCLIDHACRGGGKCTARPEICTDQLDPVCGCDGQTYPNACDAAAAGASVEHAGACAAPPGPCTSDADCRGRQLCCYPCGVAGCSNRCMDPGPGGGCPLFP